MKLNKLSNHSLNLIDFFNIFITSDDEKWFVILNVHYEGFIITIMYNYNFCVGGQGSIIGQVQVSVRENQLSAHFSSWRILYAQLCDFIIYNNEQLEYVCN